MLHTTVPTVLPKDTATEYSLLLVWVGVSPKNSFFKDNISFIQLLKIRASYGIVGSDVAMGNRYLYNQIYTATDNAYNFGQSDVTSTAINGR